MPFDACDTRPEYLGPIGASKPIAVYESYVLREMLLRAIFVWQDSLEGLFPLCPPFLLSLQLNTRPACSSTNTHRPPPISRFLLHALHPPITCMFLARRTLSSIEFDADF